MPSIDFILTLAKAYAAAEQIELKTVSWRVFGDGKKLDALLSGSELQIGRYNAALIWFSVNWPAGAAWPPNVPRPEAEAA
jgi:hypothetical protein